jgi:hypothetical protein
MPAACSRVPGSPRSSMHFSLLSFSSTHISDMDRTLYVLVYPSRLFAAHWSLWIPYVDAAGRETDIGDRIHVTGDRLNGFEYEYIRNYNIREDDRHPNSFSIGSMAAQALEHLEKNGEDDNSGILNALDRACRAVPAPGPSLNQVAATTSNGDAKGPPRRREVRDCQWWLRQAAARLTQDGILKPLEAEIAGNGNDVMSRVSRLPQH